jgi:hypothetical protein
MPTSCAPTAFLIAMPDQQAFRNIEQDDEQQKAALSLAKGGG